MKCRLRSFFIGLAALVIAGIFLNVSQAQKTFSHTTPKHREGKYSDCKVCHTLPTRNWASPRANNEYPFPDVRNFPFNEPGTKAGKHTTCVGCHAADFYKPSFCLGCHTLSGPKANAANVRPFPNRSNGTQFTTIFPHDVHQDVIASNKRRNNVAVGHFVWAAYSPTPDDKTTEFYNCSVCHKAPSKTPQWAARIPVSDEKPMPAKKDDPKPTAVYFKDVPTDHASCFTCHYQRIKPISTDCSGCHKLSDLRSTPSNMVERSSLKFNHEQLDKEDPTKRVHAKDCMTCHLTIARSSDLQILKNTSKSDVPFATCVSCHGEGGLKNITKEIDARTKDKAYQCNYCHTSTIGRYSIPKSHRE